MSSIPESPAFAEASEDRTVAILAYITIIGFIVAIVMHGSKKTALGAYHLRQALGLFITAIVGGIGLAITVVGLFLLPFFWLAMLILAIMGLLAAASGQQKPLPLLGARYQKWFANTFT